MMSSGNWSGGQPRGWPISGECVPEGEIITIRAALRQWRSLMAYFADPRSARIVLAEFEARHIVAGIALRLENCQGCGDKAQISSPRSTIPASGPQASQYPSRDK